MESEASIPMAKQESAAGPELTPSEVLLLHCDLFAPVPPLTRSARFEFEKQTATPYLFGFVVPFILWSIADQISASHYVLIRMAAAAIALAIPAGWWYRRRKLDPLYDRQDVTLLRPFGTRRALFDDLLLQAISCALLASEEAGVLRLESSGSELIARFDDVRAHWPLGSLEDQLVRGRPIPVSQLIFDWMGDGSNFPRQRAMKIVLHGAARRGLTALTEEQMGDPAPVMSLLDGCRKSRPAVWGAMKSAILDGLQRRTVPPRMQEVGQGQRVPKYDYPEMSIESMDTPSEQLVSDAVPAPEQEANFVSIGGMLIVAALASGGSAYILLKLRPGNLTSVLFLLVILPALLTVFTVVVKRRTRRRAAVRAEYGLAPEGGTGHPPSASDLSRNPTLLQIVVSNLATTTIACLPVAFWGGLVSLIPLGFVGLVWLKWWGDDRGLTAKTATEVVAARVTALKAAALAAVPSGEAERDEIIGDGAHTAAQFTPSIPEPIAALDLPQPTAQQAELLDRWLKRRSQFRRLHWISLAVLAGGYVLLVLGWWLVGWALGIIPADENTASDIIMALFIPVFLSALWLIKTRSAGAVEDETGDSRHGSIAFLILCWRVLILFEVAITISQGGRATRIFDVLALLFFAGHWVWAEWTMRQAMLRLPAPIPRRLIMLRVFGSPAFDDLAALIHPWLRVGTIEHLEGFDTVGERSDVMDAVMHNKVDKILARNLDEVQQQLAQASSEPDRALLFERHAFQCTDATWREAILAMLRRADTVLMDLSSLSPENQGCAWELGQLLEHVSLARVTLLVNDSTDLECLRTILQEAAAKLSTASPNWNDPNAVWQQIRIGGLSARQPNESFHNWQLRTDHRLDPIPLTSWLLSTCPKPDGKTNLGAPLKAVRWSRQPRWVWAVLLALTAAVLRG